AEKNRVLRSPTMSQEPRCPTCDQALPGSGSASGLPSSLVGASRLEDASLVLLAFAYLVGGLAIEWKILAVLAGVLAAAVLFVSLKYASEAMRALADVARAAARMEERLERPASARQATSAPGVASREGAP